MKKICTLAAVIAVATGMLGSAPAVAATFELPPGNAYGWYAVANNQPASGNVWRGVAQSFTALDERTQFSLFYVAPDTGRMAVDLLLHTGEPGALDPLVAARAWIEAGAANRMGVLSFDLSAEALAPGQRYTALILGPDFFDLPTEGSTPRLGIQLASTAAVPNPYAGGSFYLYGFGGSYDIADRGWPGGLDMAFRLDAVAVPEPTTVALMLAGLAGLAVKRRRPT